MKEEVCLFKLNIHYIKLNKRLVQELSTSHGGLCYKSCAHRQFPLEQSSIDMNPLRVSKAASHLQSYIRLATLMRFLQQNLGTAMERMVIPQGLKSLKNGNQPQGLRLGPHRKDSGFQFPQAATQSTPSRRKTVTHEWETTEKKMPPSLGFNDCRHSS